MADLAKTFSSDPGLQWIVEMADLQRYFGAADETLGQINRRLYKDTECGAYISVLGTRPSVWHYSSEGAWTGPIQAVQLGTIIEGSDATVDGDVLVVPVSVASLDQQIFSIEAEANILWHDANDEARFQCDVCDQIVCDHELDEHTKLHAPEIATYTDQGYAP